VTRNAGQAAIRRLSTPATPVQSTSRPSGVILLSAINQSDQMEPEIHRQHDALTC